MGSGHRDGAGAHSQCPQTKARRITKHPPAGQTTPLRTTAPPTSGPTSHTRPNTHASREPNVAEQSPKQLDGPASKREGLDEPQAPAATNKEDKTAAAPAAEEGNKLEPVQEVAFSARAPAQVPRLGRFDIIASVHHLLSDAPESDAEALTAFDLEAQVRVGSRIALIHTLEKKRGGRKSETITVFVPYQAITWHSNYAEIVFQARASDVSEDVTFSNTITVRVNGVDIGYLKFDIIVTTEHPNNKAVSDDFSHQAQDLAERQSLALITPIKIQKAFICYQSRNWSEVVKTGITLETAGIECHIDRIDLRETPNWKTGVIQWLDKVDMVAIILTKDLTINPSTKWEFEKMENEQNKRKNTNRPPLRFSIIALEESTPLNLPPWMRMDINESNRFDSYIAFQKIRDAAKIPPTAESIPSGTDPIWRPFQALPDSES